VALLWRRGRPQLLWRSQRTHAAPRHRCERLRPSRQHRSAPTHRLPFRQCAANDPQELALPDCPDENRDQAHGDEGTDNRQNERTEPDCDEDAAEEEAAAGERADTLTQTRLMLEPLEKGAQRGVVNSTHPVTFDAAAAHPCEESPRDWLPGIRVGSAPMICPSCGTANSAGRRFCGGCAAPLEQPCPSCGATNEPGMRFCGACAHPLTEEGAPVSPTAVPETASERRLVSVLFLDLVGFTTLSESRDSEDVREILSRYFESCQRLIALYGGTVEKFIGDAVMAVWGAPVATEDDAERAVRAALDLVAAVSALGDELGAPLRARAGVLTGEAAVTLGAKGEGMVAGDLVNTAARIQSAAEPGSVFVGEATRRASERSVAYEPAGEHAMKGKAEPLPLWRALRVVSGVGGQLRSQGLEAPFVGRDRELRRIKELFHACADEGRAHLVSITGIAGIGKSRLGWEFYKYFDGIVEQIWWHRGRCLAYGEGVAYWALADMARMRCRIAEDEPVESARRKLDETLRELLLDEGERRFVEPRLAQLLGLGDAESSDRQDLFAAWRLFFERLSDSNPVVLLFEDLQWADASLLDFIEYLLEWSRSHPLFVVTLARPELHEQRPGWGAGQRNFSSFYLDPLPEDAMTELLAGLVPGLPDDARAQILARAEGVPLYAVETVRMLLDRRALTRDGDVYRPTGDFQTLEVPETLQALIAARLDGLADVERRLLQVAAVLGKTFTAPSLADVSGFPADELDPLLAGLVRKEVLSLHSDSRSPEHGQYGFLQDLVRRVAYDTLARRERKQLHLAAAEWMTSAPGGDEELAEVIAAHLVAAFEALPDAADAGELQGRAADALVRAGERAASLGAAAEGQRYFEQAAALVADDAARAQLTARAGEMAYSASKPAEARVLLEEAHATFITLGNPRATARVTSLLATLDFEDGHPPQAVARLEPLVAELEQGEPDSVLAEIAGQLGRFLIFSGEDERAAPHLERAIALAELLDLPETFVQALNSKSVLALQHDRPREARILVEGALELALAHELHEAALRAYNNLSVALWSADEWQANMKNMASALELARRVGHRNWEASFVAGSIGTLDVLGRWDEALARAAEVEEIATSEFSRGLMLQAVRILAARGSLDQARALLDGNATIAQSENADFSGSFAMIESALLRAEGDLEGALASIERVPTIELKPGGMGRFILYEALEVAAARGDLDRLRELIGRLDGLRAGQLTPSTKAYRARFRALLPETDAESEFRLAERLFEELAMPFLLAVTRLEAAERLLAAGREEAAEPLLAAAREAFEVLEAAPWIERVERASTPARAQR
jgi:class 3 adenylate cyclase